MSLAAPIASAASVPGQAPIRVMVVDDAVVVRGLVSRWIEEEPGLEVVASLRTGRQAVDQVERANPDVVILDVEMPDLDGLSALPLLLERKRDLVVIMASTLTRRNAEVSLKALSFGAADYIPKPETNREVTTSATFRRDLIEKIRQLGGRRRRLAGAPAPAARRPVAVPDGPARPGVEARHSVEVVPAAAPAAHPAIKLRPFSTIMPRVLLIDSSTGGPQALTALVSRIVPVIDKVPVLITQHMPPTFTTILAEHLRAAATCGWRSATDASSSCSTTVRRSISASRRSIRCFIPRSRPGATPSWR
jgi:two-component system chemotaxis response regulator CheB